MRRRDLAPTFFKDPELVELPFEYRLLFEGLWCMADREGRLEDRPKVIRMEVFPADDVDCEEGLQALASKRKIVRYEVEGARYIAIHDFGKDQHPHPKERASEIPPPDAAMQGDLFAAGSDPGSTKEVASRAGSSGSSGSSSPTGEALAGPERKPAVRGHGDVTLKRFFEICAAAGEEPIPESDSIFAYGSKVGIPVDMLHLAWKVFREKHIDTQKRQRDWRATFRNCVKDNWYRLWVIDAANQCVITAQGRQAQLAHRKAA